MNPATSNKKLPIIAVLVVILLLAAGAVFLAARHNKNNNTTSAVTSHQAIVQVSATGFTPTTLSVKLGTTIMWENVDTSPHEVASNPYPADSSVPGLRSKSIPPSGSYTYKPTATGTINYHDELSPTHNGSIVVTK